MNKETKDTSEQKSHFFLENSTPSYKSYLLYTLKNKFQIFYLILFLLMPFWVISFIKKFLWIVNYGQTKNPNYRWPRFSDLFYSVLFAIICQIGENITIKKFYPYLLQMVKKKHLGEIRQAKALKMSNHMFKSFYYTFAITVGYLVLKDANFTPNYLLGNGDVQNAWIDFPFTPIPKHLDSYFTMAIGIHMQQLFSHSISKPRSDFFEMLLHHFVTVLLMSLAYMTNYLTYASLILFLHDWADIFAAIVRIFSETDYNAITLVFYFAVVVTWFYTRIIVLPFIIMRNLYKNALGIEGDTSAFFCMFCLLCVLQFLHIYWFGLFVKIGHRYLKFNEAENLQSKIEEIPEQKEKRISRKVIYS